MRRMPLPHRFEDRLQRFKKLMPRRVQTLLLVASAYDYYILEQEGQLDEPILTEFTDVSVGNIPAMRRVPSGRETLEALEKESFDLVITTGNLGDMSLPDFLRSAKALNPDIPIVLLAFDTQTTTSLHAKDYGRLDGVFVWQGDYRILFAIVKLVEDRWNVVEDIENLGVNAILLIEDNIRYYSSFLPMFYSEILTQSQRVIPEGLNLRNKMMRMRARPKIVLCTSYEEAWAAYERFHHHLMGIFSDVEFPKGGELDSNAGLAFAKRVREANPDLPIMLHTQDVFALEQVQELRVAVVQKDSPVLLKELRQFMVENFGFSDFVFRTTDGNEVGRAKDLRELEKALALVPSESIFFHAQCNHFSTWLKARTEFALAEAMRDVSVSDFGSPEEIRAYLIDSIREFRNERQSGGIAGFNADQFDPEVSFAKIGSGSLGGKARGLAFFRQLIYNYRLRNRISGARIFVPPTLVLTTEVFDQFLEANGIREFALHQKDDAVIERRFVEARFPKRALNRIKQFLELIHQPLAIRSSSLLEDSQYQPFAGIYSTFLIPNNDPNPRLRLRSLLVSVKKIYASTFSRRAKMYMKSSAYRLEEEKMAVVIQELVGRHHGRYFYPDIAGVAQSYNFYANPPASPRDGVVSVGVGLGQHVVEGGKTIRFSPRFPEHLPQFSSPADILRHSQSSFCALDLEDEGLRTGDAVHADMAHLPIDAAYKDGALDAVGSIYSPTNNAIYDGLSREGSPVVTFAPILKHRRFPLPELAELLLEVGTRGMNAPVVIEFAANLSPGDGGRQEFACLQMRPLVTQHEPEAVDADSVNPGEIVCFSEKVLGNGAVEGLTDLIVIDPERFDRSQSRDAAEEVAKFNARLSATRTPYILIGMGRWGASDPWLGIPVSWEQIAGAKIVVEAGFSEIRVEPSQGSHFFHNLVAGSVGYFSVEADRNHGSLDWDWLSRQPVVETGRFFRHIKTPAPLTVRMQGHRGRGYILRPTEESV